MNKSIIIILLMLTSCSFSDCNESVNAKSSLFRKETSMDYQVKQKSSDDDFSDKLFMKNNAKNNSFFDEKKPEDSKLTREKSYNDDFINRNRNKYKHKK